MRNVYKNLIIDDKETDLVAEDGLIVSIEKTKENGFDCHGLTAYPGLFDTHCHGCIGVDTIDGGAQAMAKAMAKRGITSFLPTTMTVAEDQIVSVCNSLPAHTHGMAKIRGIHLEGPFIAESRKGAQNPEFIQTPSLHLLTECPQATLITIAPELSSAEEFTRLATERGVRVSLGHTDADYDTSAKIFRAGASCLTHTFNCMPPMLHRDPGPIGAALTEGGYAQLITDGVHIHKAAVLALYRMFGSDRMIIISDMMAAAGLTDGEYELGGLPVTVRGKRATLTSSPGTLAGSATFIDDCVRTAISFGIPVKEAFRMASETPARMMGLPCGILAPGYEADFGLYDGDLAIQSTVIDGCLI